MENDLNDNNFNTEKQKSVKKAVISVVIATVMLFVFLFGFLIRGTMEKDSVRKINEIINRIESASVYYDDKTADEIARSLVKMLLDNDKYATYYSAEEYSRVLAEDKGNYSGIGIGFKKMNGVYDGTIGKIFLNSPAHKVGIKTGDKLVAGVFKGQSEYVYFSSLISENKTLLQVASEFFTDFKIGEEFKIKVLRGDVETEFTVYKAEYVCAYVEYKDNQTSYNFSTEEDGFCGRTSENGFIAGLSADTGYIKLYEFEGGAATQFAEALKYMESRGKTKLIIDLRDNGGGLISVLRDILSYLINNGGANNIKIMGVKEKDAETAFFSSKNNFSGFLTDISVIADCNTASASEALIAALHDYGDRAQFGGAQFDLGRLVLTEEHPTRHVYCTFGKGIMQTTYGLKSGGAIVFTTAYVFSPLSNKCIQDVGIETANIENRVSDEEAIARADAVLHL